MKIGVSGPFTGKRSAYGDLIKSNTFQVAKEMKLEDTVEFLFVDDKAHVPDALIAAETFINSNVNAVIGHFNSQCAQKAAEKYHEQQLLFVAPASTAVEIPYENQGFIYRTCPTNKDQIQLIKEYVIANNISSIGIFKDDTGYSNELAEITLQEFAKSNIHVEILALGDAIENIETFWLLGTHFFCMEVADVLLKTKQEANFFFCDDCYIDEFIDHVTAIQHTNQVFVVGLSHEDGYSHCYKNALRALVTHLLNDQKFMVEKENWKLYKIA
jgi:branched-chain amino acid transport system substrate-binding protein